MRAVQALLGAARRRWILTSCLAALVLVIVVGTIVSWPGPAQQHRAVYANVSRNFRVCLLGTTRDQAVADAVWPAVRSAKAHAAINAQRLVVPGTTAMQLEPYLNGLIASRCGLIVTAGPALHDAVVAVARTHPQQPFLNVGDSTGLSNVHDIPNLSNGTAQVTQAVHDSAR